MSFEQVPQVSARGARARGPAGDRRVHGGGAAQHSEGFRLLHGALLLVVCDLFSCTQSCFALPMQYVLYARGKAVVCVECAGQDCDM